MISGKMQQNVKHRQNHEKQNIHVSRREHNVFRQEQWGDMGDQWGVNRCVEWDLVTFGYLLLDDPIGFPYYRLFNVR